VLKDKVLSVFFEILLNKNRTNCVKRHHFAIDGKATDRIVNTIEDIMSDKV